MRPLGRRHWTRAHQAGEGEGLEGPLEDARAVLAERSHPDRSLLGDEEVLGDPQTPNGGGDPSDRAEAETAAERAAEVEELLGGTVESDGSLTPEELEDELEPASRPAEATLHVVDPWADALLDEGDVLEGGDDDTIEAAIDREAARDD